MPKPFFLGVTRADLKKIPDNIVQEKSGYGPNGFGGIRVEANSLLQKGCWVGLDKDRNPISVGTPEDKTVEVVGLRTIVCSPELVVDLNSVFNRGS